MPGALEQARAATLCLINREGGARPVRARYDARLTQAAQFHADDMGTRDFYDHRNFPDGAVPSARVYAQGLPPHGTTVAENVHWGNRVARNTAGDHSRLNEQPRASREHPARRGHHVGVGIGFDAPRPGHRGHVRVYATNFFGGDDAAVANPPISG